ncbi:MAG: DUF4129 domain-containing protein [Deltaproteobacteria bacterium]|jgi:hypothetical protein
MRGKNVPLLTAGAGMEISWLYAWANFVMVALFNQPFALVEGLCVFALAVALTLICQGRGWRVVYVLLLQVLGAVFATLWLIHFFSYPSYPYLDLAWVLACFGSSRGVVGWLYLALIAFLAVLYWTEGVRFARRSDDYLSICARFDLGVSALFLLFLIKFMFLLKGAVVIHERVSTFMVFPFFCFGLTAVGLARNRSEGKREFLKGYRGVGVILSFTAATLLIGTAGVTLFLPYLTKAAEMGYGVMQKTAEPLGPVLITILRFLFAGQRFRGEPQPKSAEHMAPEFGAGSESGWWSQLLEKVVGWGFLGVLGVILLVVSGIAVWYLVKWLLSKTERGGKRSTKRHGLSDWIVRMRAFLFFLWEKALLRLRGFARALQLYGALLRWGRHSGLPALASETPLEYGWRLSHQFPALGNEIHTIIEAFNQEVYGETLLTDQQLAYARRAWRRLCSPSQWPSRLRSWFFQPTTDALIKSGLQTAENAGDAVEIVQN